jgi:hypothetical protein
MRNHRKTATTCGDILRPAGAWARAPGLVFGALLWLGIAAGPAAAAEPRPLEPQPAAADLEPGLAVDYYYSFFRLIEEFEEFMEDHKGSPGEPIPMLNYRVAGGSVLTSKFDNGVGAKIDGLIHLDKAGTYSFTVQSNDGFVLDIGEVPLLEDPDVHGDRFSQIAKLTVTQPGWYPLSILYFERKGTSTLELYWRPPGEEDADMAFVPAEAFAHLKAK